MPRLTIFRDRARTQRIWTSASALECCDGLAREKYAVIYGDDLFFTISGQLLAASRTETPTFFDLDLNSVGTLHGGQQEFVTQFVPEPSSVALSLTGTLILLFAHRRRKDG
jgi:hypothetical protein